MQTHTNIFSSAVPLGRFDGRPGDRGWADRLGYIG
eukprot:SAG11_NODE_14827_length_598_cov_1.124248_1_plen_34_part_10